MLKNAEAMKSQADVRLAPGVILNIGSVQGLQSMRAVPAYAASKGALLALTRQVSR
jgi:NAD(P)-dependent dehydrogenase (short-subunit alcohol dehydrogenase family)